MRMSARVQVIAGTGLVEASDDVLAIYPGPASSGIDEVRALLAESAGNHLRHVAGFVAQADRVPPLGILVRVGTGWDVLLVGPVTLVVERDGTRSTLSAADAPTWRDQRVAPGFDLLAVVADGQHVSGDDPRLHLARGAVTGCGVALRPDPGREVAGDDAPPEGAALEELHALADPEEAPTARVPAFPPPAAPPPTPLPVDLPVVTEVPDLRLPSGEVRVLDLAAAADEAADALPRADAADEDAVVAVVAGASPPEEVDGILCELDHFNHPQALFCASCGRSTVHRTRVLVRRGRPSLGVLVLDEGTTFTLDAGYVVGREPEQDDEVRRMLLRPLRLIDPQRAMSRAHAVLRLEGWDVVVADRESANGTFLLLPGSERWMRLPRGGSQVLPPGGRLGLAGRVLSYDSHHQIRR